MRRGGRAVEGSGLENRRARKGSVSSNLTLSATIASSRRSLIARTDLVANPKKKQFAFGFIHGHYLLSPVSRKAIPESAVPDASRSRTFSGFVPARAAACLSSSSAFAGSVSAGRRKIQGTLVEVSDLSSLRATTGTKLFKANCSDKWLAL